MNENEFKELLARLGLPGGSNMTDALSAVDHLVIAAKAGSPDGDDEEARAVVSAATARLCQLTQEASLSRAVAVFETKLKRLEVLEKEVSEERAGREALEMDERRNLTADLVKMNAETPYSAWQDDKCRLPAKHLLAMTLPELRDRVKHFKAAHKGDRVAPMLAFDELSEAEVRMCESKGVDPKRYAETKKALKARSQRAEA